jgi:drug/metabolite transporter (DMT)-like permease
MLDHAATWAAVFGAFAYGSGDFLGGCASRRLTTFTTVAIAQIVAAAFMAQNIAVGGSPLPSDELAWASLLAGLAYVIGIFSLYDGLAQGRIAIVASICGLLSILIPLAGDVALSRSITGNEMAGMVFCVAAAFLVITAGKSCEGASSIGWSIRAGITGGIGFGVSDLCLGSMSPEMAAGALFVTRGVAAAIALAVALTVSLRLLANSAAPAPVQQDGPQDGGPIAWPRSIVASPGLATSIALAMTAGLLDTLGHVGYLHAATRGSMAVASALVAVFPGVTVLLAAILLRERITRGQLCGLAFGAGGIVLISV